MAKLFLQYFIATRYKSYALFCKKTIFEKRNS